MNDSTFTPPDFVEFPPVERVNVVQDGEKTSLDVRYISPEGREITMRIVLNAEQARELSQNLA